MESDIKIEEHLLDYEIDNETNLREFMLVTGKTIIKQQMKLGHNLIKIEKQTEHFGTFTDKHTNGLLLSSGEKPHNCNYCSKAFLSKKDLVRHERTHTGEKPYNCTECNKAFVLKKTLLVHQRTHIGEKPYNFNYCTKSFALKHHTGEKPYACNHCDMYFSHKQSLVRHQTAHTGEKPYACNYCNMAFSRK